MKRDRKSRVEYHLFARFMPKSCGVRVAVTLSERAVRNVGNAIYPHAHEVWYRVKERHPDTKPYRAPAHWGRTKPINWRSTL